MLQVYRTKGFKKNKRKFYINTMGVQGEGQTKIPREDFKELRFETSNHSGIQHIKSGASRFPLRVSRPTETFGIIWAFRNNNSTIIHRA